MKSLGIGLILAVMLTAPATVLAQSKAKTGGADGVRAAIEAANGAFAKAYNQGDAKAVAGMYTSDAVVLPPDSEAIQGSEAIEEFWENTMAVVKKVTLTTLDVGSSGDLAYETGEVTLAIQPEGGEPTTAEAKYVVVWKRVDGSWKLHRDIWNDLPVED